MQYRSTKKSSKVSYSRVTLRGGYSYPLNLIVRFSFSITTTKLWKSNYSEYQQYLYDRICKYKEDFLTPIGYRKISKIFNDEGLKTARNTEFSNSKVHSMYKKAGNNISTSHNKLESDKTFNNLNDEIQTISLYLCKEFDENDNNFDLIGGSKYKYKINYSNLIYY